MNFKLLLIFMWNVDLVFVIVGIGVYNEVVGLF